MPSAAASRVGVNLRASAYLHQGDRKYMEDEFQVAYQRTHDKKDIEYAFFGIFDGHGGKEAAHFAKDNLMDNIVSLRAFWSDEDEDVLAAIKEGFLQTHMAMWKELDQWPRTASGWPSTSGTTASVAFIRRQKIYIGHVGDSGIVLGYEDDRGIWHGEALTQDHKPESVVEKARITECGGKVINKSGVPRVVWNRPKSGHQGPVRRSTPMDEIPFLAVARSLGDLWSYNATNDQFVVSPEPDVCVLPVDISRHRCLIFGTDGLWNVLTPDAAVTVAHQAEKNNEKHYLGVPNACGKQRLWVNPSRSVVSGALGRYLKLNLRADNTSAVTVFLDPPGRPKREVLLQQKGLNNKKPSPSKTTLKLGQTPAEETNKDALVQVHMYNQNQGTKNEVGRRLIHIKERLPEKWQMKEEGDQESEPGGTDTGQESDEGGAGQDEPSGSDSPPAHTTKVGCAGCGCPRPSTSSMSSLDTENDSTSRVSPPTETTENKVAPESKVENSATSRLQIVPENASVKPEKNVEKEDLEGSRQETESVGDDVQIPVVSSSTVSPRTDVRGKKLRVVCSRNSPEPIPHVKGDTRRRTRSNISVPHGVEIENNVLNPNNNNEWKGEEEERASTSTKSKSVHDNTEVSPANRVLKSVNRGTPEAVSHSAAKTVTPKRKRMTEAESETAEPSKKSAKVHTRSHTWSHKPMITRSQDRSHKPPVRTCATPRK